MATAVRGKVVGALVGTMALAGSWVGPGARPIGAQATAPTHAVGVVTETFVDQTRPTAANGDCAKIPSRTLPTMIF